jgi:hypothetical protein
MKNVTRDTREGSAGDAKSKFLHVSLATLLLLLLSLLLFLGWRIADAPRKVATVEGQSESDKVRHQPDSEGPQSDKAWAERAARWRQMLKESSDTLHVGDSPVKTKDPAPSVPAPLETPSLPAAGSSLGKDLVEERALTDQGRKTAEVGLEIDTLGGEVRLGESVEIVWCSPDGTVWKRIIDRPFSVQENDEGVVRISVKAEEGRIIDSARLSGKVFAVPR